MAQELRIWLHSVSKMNRILLHVRTCFPLSIHGRECRQRADENCYVCEGNGEREPVNVEHDGRIAHSGERRVMSNSRSKFKKGKSWLRVSLNERSINYRTLYLLHGELFLLSFEDS